MATVKTHYASEPASVIRYADQVAINTNIASEERIDEQTGETYLDWSADTEYMSIHAYETIYQSANEQRQLEQDTVSADILDMILGGE